MNFRNNYLPIRVACPTCGFSDKYGIKNFYSENEIKLICHEHGEYSINIYKDCNKINL
ncbi:MAG: hypothetical protein mread185_000319 [Mycoplasmataceae bacterium]|nr:MAG: hypothetical protein mread185_000319 [Mycoplasmataceae bacterium]